MISDDRLFELWDLIVVAENKTPHDFARAVEREAYEAAARIADSNDDRVTAKQIRELRGAYENS